MVSRPETPLAVRIIPSPARKPGHRFADGVVPTTLGAERIAMATHRDIESNRRPDTMIGRAHTTRGSALTRGGRVLGIEPLMTPRRVRTPPPPEKRGWRRLFG
jgi:hypothetical protein